MARGPVLGSDPVFSARPAKVDWGSHRLHRRVSLSRGHCSDHGTSCRKQWLRRPDFQREQFCVCSQGPHVASPVRSASWPGCLRILLRTSQRPSCPLARLLQEGGRGCESFPLGVRAQLVSVKLSFPDPSALSDHSWGPAGAPSRFPWCRVRVERP